MSEDAPVVVTDEQVAVAARAMFRFHCGDDADLDVQNARVPESIYNVDTDEDEALDPDDWEPYLTDLWEGWARAGLEAVAAPTPVQAQIADLLDELDVCDHLPWVRFGGLCLCAHVRTFGATK